MFPMVKYTGHVLLSPPNCDNWVLSDEMINDAMVDPTGNFAYKEWYQVKPKSNLS